MLSYANIAHMLRSGQFQTNQPFRATTQNIQFKFDRNSGVYNIVFEIIVGSELLFGTDEQIRSREFIVENLREFIKSIILIFGALKFGIPAGHLSDFSHHFAISHEYGCRTLLGMNELVFNMSATYNPIQK